MGRMFDPLVEVRNLIDLLFRYKEETILREKRIEEIFDKLNRCSSKYNHRSNDEQPRIKVG